VSAAALVVLLAACAGLPTSGPVNYGLDPNESDEDPVVNPYVAEPPTPDASPEEIVRGFLTASYGTANNWAAAREYLTGDLVESWSPSASALIDSSGQRTFPEPTMNDDGTASITVTVRPEASLDQDGRYRVVEEETQDLDFTLAQDDDGQWRITSAPDGVVIDEPYFEELYAEHDLYYFDSTWTYLVPDARWLLTGPNTLTRIAKELVQGGPSEWLANGVHTAFTGDLEVSTTVNVDAAGAANVDISASGAAIQTTTQRRMLAQLQRSLADADVHSVQLTIDGTSVSSGAVEVASTDVDARPLVLTDDGFGFYSGGSLTEIDGISDRVTELQAASAITSITLAPDQQSAVTQQTNGKIELVSAQDGPYEVPVDDSIEPALDPFGYVWTVAGGSPSKISAWDSQIRSTDMSGAWGEYSKVTAIDVSRDGARIAAIVTSGDDSWVIASVIERDENGEPVSLGTPVRVAQLSGTGVTLSWLIDESLGMIVTGSSSMLLWQQAVGEPAQKLAAPDDAEAIDSGGSDVTARVLTKDGDLNLLRGGQRWAVAANDVLVLAGQLGQPN
ncbi:MAG: LpqB family beta-propeller domain-containing protein, partial [Microbacterium sp.]